MKNENWTKQPVLNNYAIIWIDLCVNTNLWLHRSVFWCKIQKQIVKMYPNIHLLELIHRSDDFNVISLCIELMRIVNLLDTQFRLFICLCRLCFMIEAHNIWNEKLLNWEINGHLADSDFNFSYQWRLKSSSYDP